MELNLQEMAQHADDAAALLKALANSNRLMVLCLLFEGERSVGELLQEIPLSQSALSQHLAMLRQEGLVQTRRESQTIHYSLADERVSRIIGTLHDIYCDPSSAKTQRRS